MFKFKIGDVVCPRVAQAECLLIAKAGGFNLPKRMTVRERVSVECCGGTQLFYQVAIMGEHLRVAEADIVSVDDVDFDEIVTAIVNSRAHKSTDATT